MNRQEELMPDPDAPRNVPLFDAKREAVRHAGLEALAQMLGMTVEEIEAQSERFEAMLS